MNNRENTTAAPAELTMEHAKTMIATMDDAFATIERIGAVGITVSLVYGNCGDMGLLWSVDVLLQWGESFDKPFVAETFTDAVRVLVVELGKRGIAW